MLLEVCLDSPESARFAEQGGAGRIELCANLDQGGTTPSFGTIATVRACTALPLHVMIRPHTGGCVYSELDLAVMKHDILRAKDLGADGVVFAVLRPDDTIDLGRMKELIALAQPMSVTFHRAFDLLSNLFRGLEELIDLGVEHVLTAGGPNSVVEGSKLITRLVQRSAGKIEILPGGGVTVENVQTLIRQTGVKEIHALGAVSTFYPSINGGSIFPGKYLVDPFKVRNLIQAMEITV